MSVEDNLKNLLIDLVKKDFIEEKDYKGLLKDLNYINVFKKKYEFEFEEKNISDCFDENNKNKIKNIFVVIGQENLGKTYFIKLLNCVLSKEKKLISKEEIDYQRNKINFKIVKDCLIARINLNPIFSKSEEEQKIFEYFKYSNLLLNYASKIFYVTNNENFDLKNEEYKNEINEQLIYYNFDINKDNENKFIIVKNLFYKNFDNKFKDDTEIISSKEIILSSELFDNLKQIKQYQKKEENDNNKKKDHNIILYNEVYRDIVKYYLKRYDFSRQLNNCDVDYNYGIDHENRLSFYIEVPEENEYKITAKSIELEKYVLISIVGEIVGNNNNNENTKKKFEIYENIEKKKLENENEKVYSIEKEGISQQIKEERAYLVTF